MKALSDATSCHSRTPQSGGYVSHKTPFNHIDTAFYAAYTIVIILIALIVRAPASFVLGIAIGMTLSRIVYVVRRARTQRKSTVKED